MKIPQIYRSWGAGWFYGVTFGLSALFFSAAVGTALLSEVAITSDAGGINPAVGILLGLVMTIVVAPTAALLFPVTNRLIIWPGRLLPIPFYFAALPLFAVHSLGTALNLLRGNQGYSPENFQYLALAGLIHGGLTAGILALKQARTPIQPEEAFD